MSATELSVAIVGAGPSGFYAAAELLEQRADARISLIEQFPTPYGLVRHGVAPDHGSLRKISALFERTGRNHRVRFFGATRVPVDVSLSELIEHHHAIIIASGAPRDRTLGVEGGYLERCHTALAFTGWYNGHPLHAQQKFDLAHRSAVIVGFGNVALDIARILLREPDSLRRTDIASDAMNTLAQSKITDVHLVARRGPADVRCSPDVLREVLELPGVEVTGIPAATELPSSGDLRAQQVAKVFAGRVDRRSTGVRRRLHLHFHQTPSRLIGVRALSGIDLMRSDSGSSQPPRTANVRVDAQLLFSAIGQVPAPLPGLVLDLTGDRFLSSGGRVLREKGIPIFGHYVCGWAKRGAQGTIGTNRNDSAETVGHLLQDALPLLSRPIKSHFEKFLTSRNPRCIDFDGWLRIDAAEVSAGHLADKPRVKYTDINRMLAVANGISNTGAKK